MTARLVTGVVSGTPDQVHTLDGKTHEGAVVIDVAEPFVLVHHTDRDGKRPEACSTAPGASRGNVTPKTRSSCPD